MSEDVQTVGVLPGRGTAEVEAGAPPPARGDACAPQGGGERTGSGFDLGAWYRALKVTESPVVPLPAAGLVDRLVQTEAGLAELAAVLKRREELIGAMKEDPLRYGWKPWYWERAERLLEEENELLILGGNRSGKTQFAANYAVQSMVRKPGSWWAFLHSSADSSKRQQQPRILSYLPPEWRRLGKVGKSVYVSWTDKNGFADGVFILPNGSRGYFFNYMQDKAVLEGDEWDGAWCDELVPLDFVEALRWRLVTRKGKLIVTFTPVMGYTPTVGKFLAGAKVIETQESVLLAEKVNVKDCPKGTMPFVLKSSGGRAEGLKGSSYIICFFTQWNAFNPYDEAIRKLHGEPETVIKMRAYGWPEKAGGVAFPKFGAMHIVPRAKEVEMFAPMGRLVPAHPWKNLYKGRLPWRGTNYRVVDPAPLKNWVIKWFRCDEYGRFYIYREWPDMGSYGAWAVAGKKPDGEEGPAQRAGFGKGILDYKKMILEAEGWIWDEAGGLWRPGPAGVETIMGSVMDARGGGSAVPSAEKVTSILQLMNEAQVDRDGRIVGPSLDFREAAGLAVGFNKDTGGLAQLNEWISYDEDRPVDPLNCPKLYVVEDCEQSVYAYREYTGLDGEKGNLKDIIDPDRYFRTTPGLCFIGENDLGSYGGGGY